MMCWQCCQFISRKQLLTPLPLLDQLADVLQLSDAWSTTWSPSTHLSHPGVVNSDRLSVPSLTYLRKADNAVGIII